MQPKPQTVEPTDNNQQSRVEAGREKLRAFLWGTPDLAELPWYRALAVFCLRVVYVMVREFREGQLTLRAMSLVYTTLLSLVPLLALSFSVLKAFGVHNRLEPTLLQLLAPLGEKATEITERVINFVENVQVGVLGALGVGLLFYTVVALMQKVERAFNYTWHVRRTRPIGQRFRDYLSVLIVGPVLVFSSIGVSASVLNSDLMQAIADVEPFGSILNLATRALPYLMIIAAFTFIYVFIPNTRVKVGSALAGAIVAGILWQATGWVFAAFIAGSTKYTAIYSAFATLIFFMIWLYLSWLILLVGASIAFYHQHPEYLLSPRHEPRLSNRVREHLALEACALIARRFRSGDPGPSATSIARELMVPRDAVLDVLETLETERLLVRTVKGDGEVFVPGREPERIPLADILKTVRRAEETPDQSRRLSAARTAELAERVDDALARALEELTLADLADQSRPPDSPEALVPTDRSGTK